MVRITIKRPNGTVLDVTDKLDGSPSFSTLANGGYGSCTITLQGKPMDWWDAIPFLSEIEITRGAQVVYQGRLEDNGLQISDTVKATKTFYGRSRCLDNAIRRIWVKRDVPFVQVPEMQLLSSDVGYPLMAVSQEIGFTPASYGITVGTVDPGDETRKGLRIEVVQATTGRSGVQLCDANAVWWSSGGLNISKIRFDFDGVVANDADRQAFIHASATGNIRDWREVWTHGIASGQVPDKGITINLPYGTQYLRFGLIHTLVTTGTGPSGAIWENLRIIGDTVEEYDQRRGTILAGVVLNDLIQMFDDLQVGTIDAGLAFPLEAVTADERKTGRDVIGEITPLFTHEWFVWEDGRFDWMPIDPNRIDWIIPLTDIGELDVRATLDSLPRTVYVKYQDLVSEATREVSSVSGSDMNPFVRVSKQSDVVVEPGFPMTKNTAQQLADTIAGYTAQFPPAEGSITLRATQIVRHASGQAREAFTIRAGENVAIPDLPKSKWLRDGQDGETLFHITATDVDLQAGTVRLTIGSDQTSTEVLMARLTAATNTGTGSSPGWPQKKKRTSV